MIIYKHSQQHCNHHYSYNYMPICWYVKFVSSVYGIKTNVIILYKLNKTILGSLSNENIPYMIRYIIKMDREKNIFILLID